MIYLAKLVINLQEREGRRDVTNCHELHRTVMSAFGGSTVEGSARQEQNVLFRLVPGYGPQAILYIQSNVAPDVACWEGRRHLSVDRMHRDGYILLTDPARTFSPDLLLNFDLLACAAKKTGGTTRQERLNGQKINSRRVGLASPESRSNWLRKKALQCGFQLISVYESGCKTITGTKPDGSRILHVGTNFQGLLRVQDSTRFAECLGTGIGAGKAHGLGLLMVARFQG